LISSFHILTSVTDTSDCRLYIVISGHGISYWALKADNTCFALSVYHFDTGTTNEKAAGYLKDIAGQQLLLQQTFKKIHIIYAFAESLLVPDKFMNAATNNEMMELVYGDMGESITRSDFIPGLALQNVYKIPKQLDAVIAHLFSLTSHSHLYSILSNRNKQKGNQLYCIFGATSIIVQLIKEGKLQIIQHFDYKMPEDAAYHLLHVCERFEVLLTDTEVLLNGMIDRESILFNELNKYFPLLSFAVLPQTFSYDKEIKTYPAHYFSHLFEITACG
jgi:hypothetical protein